MSSFLRFHSLEVVHQINSFWPGPRSKSYINKLKVKIIKFQNRFSTIIGTLDAQWQNSRRCSKLTWIELNTSWEQTQQGKAGKCENFNLFGPMNSPRHPWRSWRHYWHCMFRSTTFSVSYKTQGRIKLENAKHRVVLDGSGELQCSQLICSAFECIAVSPTPPHPHWSTFREHDELMHLFETISKGFCCCCDSSRELLCSQFVFEVNNIFIQSSLVPKLYYSTLIQLSS